MDIITYALCKKLIKTSIEALGDIFTLKGNVASVDQLPSTGNQPGDIYFVGPNEHGSYDEYYWSSNNTWEIMGSTGPGFDGIITDEIMYKGQDGTGTLENPAEDTILYEINSNFDNYVQKTGDVMTGALTTTELTVGSRIGTIGTNSSTMGAKCEASGIGSHAEGGSVTASGICSHAEGDRTKALGNNSHAEGSFTIAASGGQHVQGHLNIADEDHVYAHILGNGSSTNERSNAHTIKWNGEAWFSGDVYTGSTSGTNKDAGSKKLATENYVDTNLSGKQDILTQGNNISIVNNVISATDTTYTAGTNINITNNTISALGQTIKELTSNTNIKDLDNGLYLCKSGITLTYTTRSAGSGEKSFICNNKGYLIINQIEHIEPGGRNNYDLRYYYTDGANLKYGTLLDASEVGSCITITEIEDVNNKVTSINGSSTDTQYPSAKLLYDQLALKESEIEVLEAENADLLAQIPIATATGETINVQDSSNLPIKDFSMLGNATQETTSGKNLISGLKLGYYAENDGEYHYQTDCTCSKAPISVNNVSTFTFSKDNAIIGGYAYPYDNENNYLGRVQISSLDGIYTPANNVSYFNFAIGSGSVSQVPLDSKVQIEVGSSRTSYEPYTGGKASPNPDYPQDIHVVTGDNTLTICGKNLINEAYLKTAAYDDSEAYANTAVNMPKNVTLYTNANLKAGKTAISGLYVYISNYGKNPTKASRKSRFINNGTVETETSITFNTEDTIYFCVYPKTTSITTLLDTYNFSVSVTSGDTYKQYEGQSQLISLGSIELAKIPNTDIKDVMFKAVSSNNPLKPSYYDTLPSEVKASLTVGSWYKRAECIKNSITSIGSLYSSVGEGYIGAQKEIINLKSNSRENGLCKQLVPVNSTFNATQECICFGASNQYLYIILANSRIANPTIDNWNSYLLANPLEVYYPLATPTYTPITDTTLIAQLENVLKMYTNKNVTNAWIEPTGSNAQGGLTLTYRQDLQTKLNQINNLEARLTLLET